MAKCHANEYKTYSQKCSSWISHYSLFMANKFKNFSYIFHKVHSIYNDIWWPSKYNINPNILLCGLYMLYFWR